MQNRKVTNNLVIKLCHYYFQGEQQGDTKYILFLIGIKCLTYIYRNQVKAKNCKIVYTQEFITSQKNRIILHTQELHRIKKIVVGRPWGFVIPSIYLGIHYKPKNPYNSTCVGTPQNQKNRGGKTMGLCDRKYGTSSVDRLLVQTRQSEFWYENGSNDRSDSIVRKVKEAKVLISLFGKRLLVQTRQSEFWYENGSYDSSDSIVRKVNRVLGMIEANLL